jgi:hypothetical protein
VFGQPETGVKVAREGFFRDLLPRNIDTKRVKAVGVRMARCKIQEGLICVSGAVAGLGGKGLFQCHGGLPVRPEFVLCMVKCGLCG